MSLGEINENQKLELEKSKVKVRDLEKEVKEVKELRQKITSLSNSVDQLNDCIKNQKSEIT